MKNSGFSGLNTVADPARLGPDKNGIVPLTRAVNVTVDKYNRLSRRLGTTQQRAESSHSIWCDGGPCLFVSAGSLFQLNDDYTRKGLRSGLTDTRMSFCQVGHESYYCNGFENGVVKDGVSRSWTMNAYVGARTDRRFSDPPIGHLVAFYNSSVWVAKDNEAFYSDPQFSFSWFDLFANRLKEKTRIRLLAPVKDGIYIGDETGIWFYAQGVERIKVADYPAIEGAVAFCDASEVSAQMTGRSAIITTEDGICLAAPGGLFLNLTEDTLTYPSAVSGASVISDNRLITLLHE